MSAETEKPEPRNVRLVLTCDWEQVRAQFSDEERTAMNGAITATVICPRGGVVDLDRLTPGLREKLTLLLTPVEDRRRAPHQLPARPGRAR